MTKLESEEKELQKSIDSKSAELESKLKLLGATSEKDLETSVLDSNISVSWQRCTEMV